jgi:hypothetical protein
MVDNFGNIGASKPTKFGKSRESPSKIKIYEWRSLLGVIPCLGVLANRHVIISGLCPLLSLGVKDLRHLLFDCSRAKEICLGLKMEARI